MVGLIAPGLANEASLARYLAEIRKFPMLETTEEYALAKRWRESCELEAAHRLVTSHLRLVAKIAMGYRGYGLPISEVVSEGNIGLLQAVKRFDADRGFRLATYAMCWIKAAIQDYILRSWSLVKVATTASQKKLFFNLRKVKARIAALDEDLKPGQVEQIANRLQVARKDIVEMNLRLNGDLSLNTPLREESGGEWQERLVDDSPDQECVLVDDEERCNRLTALRAALCVLGPRERRIFEARRLAEDPIKLDDLSVEFGVSRERVRQIESRAFEKVQAAVRKNLAAREAAPVKHSTPVLASEPAHATQSPLRRRSKLKIERPLWFGCAHATSARKGRGFGHLAPQASQSSDALAAQI